MERTRTTRRMLGTVSAALSLLAISGCAAITTLPPRAGSARSAEYRSRFTRETAKVAYRPGNESDYVPESVRRKHPGELAATPPQPAPRSPEALALLKSALAAAPAPEPEPLPVYVPEPEPVRRPEPVAVLPPEPVAAPVAAPRTAPVAAPRTAPVAIVSPRPRPLSRPVPSVRPEIPAPAVSVSVPEPSASGRGRTALQSEEARLLDRLSDLKDERRAIARATGALRMFEAQPGAKSRASSLKALATYANVNTGRHSAGASVAAALGALSRGDEQGALRDTRGTVTGLDKAERKVMREISGLTDRRRAVVRLMVALQQYEREPSAANKASYAKALALYDAER